MITESVYLQFINYLFNCTQARFYSLYWDFYSKGYIFLIVIGSFSYSCLFLPLKQILSMHLSLWANVQIKSMTVNVSTWLGHGVLRYLFKHYSGCFYEGVLNITIIKYFSRVHKINFTWYKFRSFFFFYFVECVFSSYFWILVCWLILSWRFFPLFFLSLPLLSIPGYWSYGCFNWLLSSIFHSHILWLSFRALDSQRYWE